jgi:hypothetical protein
MKIQVRIERLVLEGLDVPRAQQPLLQAAVEAELGRLLAQGGLAPGLASGTAVPSVRAEGITAARQPAEMGARIARSVYGGIGGRQP